MTYLDFCSEYVINPRQFQEPTRQQMCITQKQKESTAKKIKSRKPYAIMNDMRGLCGQIYYINMNHICISPFEQWMSPWLMIVCGKTLHVNHIHMAFHISFFYFFAKFALVIYLHFESSSPMAALILIGSHHPLRLVWWMSFLKSRFIKRRLLQKTWRCNNNSN